MLSSLFIANNYQIGKFSHNIVKHDTLRWITSHAREFQLKRWKNNKKV